MTGVCFSYRCKNLISIYSVLVDQKPKRFQFSEAYSFEDSTRFGSDAITIHEFVGDAELFVRFSGAKDIIETFHFMINSLLTHEFILQQDQQITRGHFHLKVPFSILTFLFDLDNRSHRRLCLSLNNSFYYKKPQESYPRVGVILLFC